MVTNTEQIFGNWQDMPAITAPHNQMVLDATHLAAHWRRCSLSSDFWARYTALFIPESVPAGRLRRSDAENVLAYLLNELFENCAKFSNGPNQMVCYQSWVGGEQLVFQITNHITPNNQSPFVKLITELLEGDPDELYFQKLEENAELDISGSGLGYLTLIKDYAQLSIKQDMSSPSETTEELLERITELESELNDLQLLYETTMDHGTSLENELMAQNDRMTTLQNKMRKYLSPQLYQALVGGTTEVNTKSHARTHLSIYFSDVVGFSDLTDSIEPELLSDILNSYLTRMSEIALKHGGTIDKFIGDAIMVFFGAPEYIDDVTHAQSCVLMALDMREALFQLRETWKIKGITRNLQIRAGINSGTVRWVISAAIIGWTTPSLVGRSIWLPG